LEGNEIKSLPAVNWKGGEGGGSTPLQREYWKDPGCHIGWRGVCISEYFQRKVGAQNQDQEPVLNVSAIISTKNGV
jgi:hypothetical protein